MRGGISGRSRDRRRASGRQYDRSVSHRPPLGVPPKKTVMGPKHAVWEGEASSEPRCVVNRAIPFRWAAHRAQLPSFHEGELDYIPAEALGCQSGRPPTLRPGQVFKRVPRGRGPPCPAAGLQPKTTVDGGKHRRCGRARLHPSPAVWSSATHRPIGATNIVAVAWASRDGRSLFTERREAKPTAIPRWAWIDHKPPH